MKKNPHMKILEAAMEKRISQLARRYSLEAVVEVWEEIKMAGRDHAFFSVCRWKPEMTLIEALEGLDDYCDFLEAMIWKRQKEERGESHYIPALYQ